MNQTNLCPKCGVNWDAIKDSLKLNRDSDDFQTAIKIIKNCEECRLEFKKMW